MNKKILIIDIDSKIPNLALKKIEKYHKDRGDEVTWNFPLLGHLSDKVYVSAIYSQNKYQCDQWEGRAEIGGSGYDIKKTLPKEIEAIKPKINLGFTTRGCIRKCPFCIVWQKEGKIRVEGDIYDIWDGKTKNVVLLDNNILALPKHFKLICSQLRKEKIRVDFNQGLDCRLLTQEIVDELKSISHVEYRFSFDDPKLLPVVKKTIDLLKKNNINRCTWYVLVGFNTTFQEDLDRLNFLRDKRQNPYLQRYSKERKYIPLARWVNQRHLFHSMTYKECLKKCEKEIGGKYKTEFKSPPLTP